MPKVIELQNFSVWFFVTFPCDWWKRNSRRFFSEPNWKLRKKSRLRDNYFQACGRFINFSYIRSHFLLLVVFLCVSDLLWRLLNLVLVLGHSIEIRSVKFPHSPILHYALSSWIEKKITKTIHCHWENRFGLTIVWGCAEILRWTKLSSELRFPSFTSQNFLMTNENVCKFLHVSFLYPQISVVRFGLLWSPSLHKRYFCTAHIQLLLLFFPQGFSLSIVCKILACRMYLIIN